MDSPQSDSSEFDWFLGARDVGHRLKAKKMAEGGRRNVAYVRSGWCLRRKQRGVRADNFVKMNSAWSFFEARATGVVYCLK